MYNRDLPIYSGSDDNPAPSSFFADTATPMLPVLRQYVDAANWYLQTLSIQGETITEFNMTPGVELLNETV